MDARVVSPIEVEEVGADGDPLDYREVEQAPANPKVWGSNAAAPGEGDPGRLHPPAKAPVSWGIAAQARGEGDPGRGCDLGLCWERLSLWSLASPAQRASSLQHPGGRAQAGAGKTRPKKSSRRSFSKSHVHSRASGGVSACEHAHTFPSPARGTRGPTCIPEGTVRWGQRGARIPHPTQSKGGARLSPTGSRAVVGERGWASRQHQALQGHLCTP